MIIRIVMPALLALTLAGAAAGQGTVEREVFLFRGECEPSGALSLGSGRFVMADDEESDLRVYNKTQPGDPVEVRISELPGLEDTADLEGAARSGEILYLITSHSSNRRGEQRPTRRRLFALRIDPQTLAATPVGSPYTKLLEDLGRDANLAKHRILCASELPAEEPGALNIEGLAAKDGKLLIGFRSPIRGGKALVVTLENPQEVLTQGASASFATPIELDLDGLGIRSFEHWPTRSVFVIIAGSSDSSGRFQAFSWSGNAADRPVPMEDVDFTGLVPEALFIDPDAPNEWFVLSDDGDVCPKPKAFRGARFIFPAP